MSRINQVLLAAALSAIIGCEGEKAPPQDYSAADEAYSRVMNRLTQEESTPTRTILNHYSTDTAASISAYDEKLKQIEKRVPATDTQTSTSTQTYQK